MSVVLTGGRVARHAADRDDWSLLAVVVGLMVLVAAFLLLVVIYRTAARNS